MGNNMKKIVLALSLVLGFSSFASAQEKAEDVCLDMKRVQKVRDTFRWTTSYDDNGKKIADGDICNPKSPYYRAMKAWIMLEDFPMLETKKDEFNYSVLGTSSSRFVRSRVNVFNFDRSDSYGCKNEGVAAYVLNYQPTVYLCPSLDQYSTLFLIEIFVHESRHVDKYPHSMCTRGNMADAKLKACDNKYSDGGSYGVGAEFNVRVSRTESIDPAIRAEARAAALDALMNRFNRMPVGLADGVLAQTDKREMYFVNLEKTTLFKQDVPAGNLAIRWGNPVWFDADAAQVLTADVAGNVGPAGGTLAEDYRTTYSQEQRKAMIDVLYSLPYACQLTETTLKCETKKVPVAIQLPGKPISFVKFKDDFGIIFEGGNIIVMPRTFEELKSKDISKWQVGTSNDTYKNFVAFDGVKGISLDFEGRLKSSDGMLKKGTYLPGLEALKFEKVVGPVIWSPKLKDL